MSGRGSRFRLSREVVVGFAALSLLGVGFGIYTTQSYQGITMARSVAAEHPYTGANDEAEMWKQLSDVRDQLSRNWQREAELRRGMQKLWTRQTRQDAVRALPASAAAVPAEVGGLTTIDLPGAIRGELPEAVKGAPCSIFLAILAVSHGKGRRDKIRATWLKQAQGMPAVQGRFFIGRAETAPFVSPELEAEIAEYKDIVVLDVPDTYDDLVMKVREMFWWAVTNFAPDFVLKIDDDCYVNLKVMLGVADTSQKSRMYWGTMAENMPIIRNRQNRNHEAHLPAKMRIFPPYASGAGYMVSADIARYIAKPPLEPLTMRNEDAYVGVSLLPYNITRVHSDLVFAHGVMICTAVEDIGVVHYVKDKNGQDCMNDLHEIIGSNNGTEVCNSRFCGPMVCDFPKPHNHKKCAAENTEKGKVAAWVVNDAHKACEGNSEGIEKISFQDGIKGIECCRQLCDQTCGCAAVDYFKGTLWCTLYPRSCTNAPRHGNDQPSSWKRVPA